MEFLLRRGLPRKKQARQINEEKAFWVEGTPSTKKSVCRVILACPRMGKEASVADGESREEGL